MVTSLTLLTHMLCLESLHTLGYSVLLLSADLHNPLVRSKMTRREFIRNIRPILGPGLSDDFLCRPRVCMPSLPHTR